MSKELEKYSDEIFKCIRCGACRAVCPTFGEELSEIAVARGRMALVEAVIEGDLDLTPAFEKAIFHCTMCGACKANCPSGVDVPSILEAARADLVKQKGSEPLMRYLAKQALKDKKAMDRSFLLMALGSAAYGPLSKTPLSKYLPMQPKGGAKRYFPKLPLKPLSKRVPELSRVDKPKGTVAFFAGCVINYVYPEIGESTIAVLNRAGYNVLLAKSELCCGKPLKSLGEADAYAALANDCTKVLAGMKADAYITACPTCALTLKEDYPKILPESDGARRVADKVTDINKFIVEQSDLIKGLDGLETSVTYHDPCHLNFGLGIKKQPRELIHKATGGGLIEMAEADRCCGFGGSFSFMNYELSGRIAERKARNIATSEASLVATACPGCMMHLRDALARTGNNIDALHTVQIIDKALRKQRGEKK